MTRTMYDSTQPHLLPKDGDLYAGYINGMYTAGNYDEVKQLFPNKEVLSITTNGNPTVIANIADVENWDYGPPAGAQWAANMAKTGRRPTLYCSRSTYTALVPELAKQGLQFGTHVDCWLATLDGTTTSNLVGVVAIQHTDTGSYDVTTVLNDFWYPEVPPMPNTNPTSATPAVGFAVCPTGGYWIACADGGVFSFGGAQSYGSMYGKGLVKPIVGIAATATGKGYYLLGGDGGVFTFGDAKYEGRVMA